MVKALSDRVVVKTIDDSGEEVTKGGIYVPTTAKDNKAAAKGKVISAGPDVKELKVDDVVLFHMQLCVAFTSDHEEYYVIPEEDVLGLVE